jgi:integrase
MSKVTVNRCTVRGRAAWIVAWRVAGQRKRAFYPNRSQADAKAEEVRISLVTTRAAALELPAHARQAILDACAETIAGGATVEEIVATIRGRQALVAAGPAPTLAATIDELVAAKEKAGRAAAYTSGLRRTLGDFAQGIESAPIASVGLPAVESYLDRKQLASRATLRTRLSTLFKFAVRRGYRADNPCARLETVSVPVKPPVVFTLGQLEAALGFFRGRPRASAWFALSTFCGLRPEEAEKTRREDIHLDEGWVRVEAQTSKIGQRRVVYPRPEALQAIARALKRGAELPLDKSCRRRAIRALRAKLGLPVWVKDITRHSAASYWLAAGESAARVADALGHSERILKRHYRAVVTRKDAEAFWRLVGKKS